jgi:hypothetical protein
MLVGLARAIGLDMRASVDFKVHALHDEARQATLKVAFASVGRAISFILTCQICFLWGSKM